MRGSPAYCPPATATKTASVVSDPVNGTLSPKAIPGALVDYTITVTNVSGAVIDSGSLVVIDAIPAQEKFCVGDLGVSGSGPISFSVGENLTGLAYTSLSSATDDIDFSNTNGATWSYTPSPDATGCDAAVTTIRVHPHGVTAVAGAFNVRFRVRLK